MRRDSSRESGKFSQFEHDDAFALAPLALNPHVTEMGKPHTKFEPIQLKDDSGWYVRITLPHECKATLAASKRKPKQERGLAKIVVHLGMN
jgi:hypothetical protein